MRLARPVYESMPLLYAVIGGVAILLLSLDPQGPGSAIAMAIAVLAEVAALTVFLRRQDHRALRREYTGKAIDLPSRLDG